MSTPEEPSTQLQANPDLLGNKSEFDTFLFGEARPKSLLETQRDLAAKALEIAATALAEYESTLAVLRRFDSGQILSTESSASVNDVSIKLIQRYIDKQVSAKKATNQWYERMGTSLDQRDPIVYLKKCYEITGLGYILINDHPSQLSYTFSKLRPMESVEALKQRSADNAEAEKREETRKRNAEAHKPATTEPNPSLRFKAWSTFKKRFSSK